MTISGIFLQFATGVLIHMEGSFSRSRKNSLERLFVYYANFDKTTIIFSNDHGSLFFVPILPKPYVWLSAVVQWSEMGNSDEIGSITP
jgi:hypothetical protein